MAAKWYCYRCGMKRCLFRANDPCFDQVYHRILLKPYNDLSIIILLQVTSTCWARTPSHGKNLLKVTKWEVLCLITARWMNLVCKRRWENAATTARNKYFGWSLAFSQLFFPVTMDVGRSWIYASVIFLDWERGRCRLWDPPRFSPIRYNWTRQIIITPQVSEVSSFFQYIMLIFSKLELNLQEYSILMNWTCLFLQYFTWQNTYYINVSTIAPNSSFSHFF